MSYVMWTALVLHPRRVKKTKLQTRQQPKLSSLFIYYALSPAYKACAHIILIPSWYKRISWSATTSCPLRIKKPPSDSDSISIKIPIRCSQRLELVIFAIGWFSANTNITTQTDNWKMGCIKSKAAVTLDPVHGKYPTVCVIIIRSRWTTGLHETKFT